MNIVDDEREGDEEWREDEIEEKDGLSIQEWLKDEDGRRKSRHDEEEEDEEEEEEEEGEEGG